MDEWNLGKEIYTALHQWVLLLAFVIIGCLLGLAAAQMWQPPFQAASELYIGLNAYRAYADSTFSAFANQEYTNLDDYKNWQMAQLNELIFTSEFLEETLARLQKEDPFWASVQAGDLRRSLRAEWRTAGKWRLISQHADAQRARQAVQTWKQVLLEKVQDGIDNAQKMIEIDIQMQAAAQARTHAASRLETGSLLSAALGQEEKSLSAMHADATLSGLQRQRILALASQMADFTPAWLALLNLQPAVDARASEYLTWIAQVQAAIQAEAPVLQAQQDTWEKENRQLLKSYEQAVKTSRGLSANLEVQDVNPKEEAQLSQARPLGLFPLVGGLLGMVVFLVLQLLRITRQSRAHA